MWQYPTLLLVELTDPNITTWGKCASDVSPADHWCTLQSHYSVFVISEERPHFDHFLKKGRQKYKPPINFPDPLADSLIKPFLFPLTVPQTQSLLSHQHAAPSPSPSRRLC